MELKIDLLGRRKSLGLIILGIIWIFLGIIKPIIGEILSTLDWIIVVLFALNGIVFIIEGLGYSRSRLFGGKAYVLINSESISLKSSAFSKKQFVNWSDVKLIDCDNNLSKFKIEKTDNTTMVIDLFEFNYALVKEIKQAINSIAKEKNILTTKNNI